MEHYSFLKNIFSPLSFLKVARVCLRPRRTTARRLPTTRSRSTKRLRISTFRFRRPILHFWTLLGNNNNNNNNDNFSENVYRANSFTFRRKVSCDTFGTSGSG
jgi:hypothetical protein